jgi:hypothetical protein
VIDRAAATAVLPAARLVSLLMTTPWVEGSLSTPGLSKANPGDSCHGHSQPAPVTST